MWRLWQTTLKKKVENNPNHAPSGDSKGGQFSKGDGAGSGDDKKDDTKKDTPNTNLKTKGKFSKPEWKEPAIQAVNKAIDSTPEHLKQYTGKITITDRPGNSGDIARGAGYHPLTDEITIHPSGDHDYNVGLLTHELSHREYSHLTSKQRTEWETSDIMKEPVSTYTQKILQDKGDKKIKKGVMNVNTFRDEQYAELSRIIHTKQSKYLAQITTKTLDKQIAFFKTMSKTEESKCPDCGEDVALSGDHSRADIDKKKKKIAKVPRGFEFNEALDEHWQSITEVLNQRKLAKIWGELKPSQRRDLLKKLKVDTKLADLDFKDLSDANKTTLSTLDKSEFATALTVVLGVGLAGLALNILDAPIDKPVSKIKDEPIPKDTPVKKDDPTPKDEPVKKPEPTSKDDPIQKDKPVDTKTDDRQPSFNQPSSFVGQVEYFPDELSMNIRLNNKLYSFCNVSERLYDSFEGAGSKGAFFNREIKTLHDC